MQRTYLGAQRLLVELDFGGRLVVPTWNLDVATGIIRDGVIEPWTTAAVKALVRRGATYVNVGANFGYYMILGAFLVDRGGTVVAVEANPHLVPDLLRSIYWSGFPDVVRLHQCAASDRAGDRLSLNFDPQFIGGGSVQGGSAFGRDDPSACFWSADKVPVMKTAAHRVQMSVGFYASVEVETETLDTILADVPQVDVLHMDIEGSEPAAILGAEQAIRRSPDLSIIMEWSPSYAAMGDNPGRVARMYELLRDEAFSLHLIEPGGRLPDRFPPTRPVKDLQALMSTPHGDLVWLKAAAAKALKVQA